MTADRSAIEELIYESCTRLDERDFAGFMKLCHPDFHYRLMAHSAEIGKDMTWLDRDREEFETFLTKMLPLHNTDHAELTRNATVYRVDIDEPMRRARAISAFQIYRTARDGGATQLLAVGRYFDAVSLDQPQAPLLLTRTVRLVTRDLGWGHHVPF